MSLAGDDPEHVVVVPGGLFAPTAKAGSTAAISGDEVESDFAKQGEVADGGAMAHPAVILTEGDIENQCKAFSMLQWRRMTWASTAGSSSQLVRK